jgi:hypothetical protein
MFRIMMFIVLIMLLDGAATVRAESGPCQESALRKKVACLNKRLGDLEKAVAMLPAKSDLDKVAASATAAATSAVFEKLKAVKIEWTDHPGVCLFFNDWTTKPERTAYSVEGCRGPAQSGFNMSVLPR